MRHTAPPPLAAIACCATLSLALPAWAQTQTPDAGRDRSAVEEIIITSERRAENLQDVPVAVTALTAETIERERVEKLSDIALMTPNFTIGQQSPTQPELTIRGIGSSDREAGSDRSVVVFVDEVYIGRAGASTFDLFDLERIEVLRGPQGTLYGRNVVGGAINLISARPTEEARAKFHVGLGSEGLFELKGLISGALSEGMNGKFSASIKQRDGFWTQNLFDENDVITGTQNSGAPSSQSFRGQLYFEPSGGLDAMVTLEISSDEVDGVPAQISQGGAADDRWAAGQGRFGGPNYQELDPFVSETNVFGEITRDSTALYAKINLEQSYGVWTFIPAYRQNNLNEFRDIGSVRLRGRGNCNNNCATTTYGFESSPINDEAYTALSFETRLASLEGGNFDWVTGLYFLSEDIARDQIRQRTLGASASANPQVSRPLFDQNITTTSLALFGQFTWDLIPDRLSLTAGGRFTNDSKSFDMAVVNTLTTAQQTAITDVCGPGLDDMGNPRCQSATLNPASAEYTASASDSWAEFTPRFSIDFKLSDSWLVYGTLSQGFKSGGFSGLAGDQLSAETPFAPETADNLEFGFKGSVAQNRWQFNISYFSMSFNDLQIRRRFLTEPGNEASAVVTISNAAEAEMSGLEFEMRAAPTDNLQLTASVATLDATVVSALDPSILVPGSALPRAPESQIGLGINYFVPLGAADLEIGGNLHSIGEFYFHINELAPGLEPAHTLMNFHLNYNANSWSTGLWIKNLTDETYRSHVQSNGSGLVGFTQYGDPMTLGVEFKMNFGP